ncbi:MAG: alcohol dehydrogenase catalytic domain-containing protein, partial [Acidimicrobiaceae bacterium]|nr:alcohol dehydrogenase catalytic domain-containing protein [Acidimicrobiaceae bacterium]
MDMARAVIQTAVNRYEMREIPIPDPGPDGAILRVEANGLCGSDIEVFRGVLAPGALPLAPGHEALGVIERLGAGGGRGPPPGGG